MKICLLLMALCQMMAADRLPLDKVSLTGFLSEIQRNHSENGRTLMSFYFSKEYWQVSLGQNGKLPKRQVDEMVKSLDGQLMICLVDMTVSELGVMKFRDKAEIASRLRVTSRRNNTEHTLKPVESDESNALIGILGSGFARGMGKLGEGMAMVMYKLEGDDDTRFSVYEKSEISVSYDQYNLNFQAPVDALFVPRVLKNGKSAHVSWLFDPWTGEKIEP